MALRFAPRPMLAVSLLLSATAAAQDASPPPQAVPTATPQAAPTVAPTLTPSPVPSAAATPTPTPTLTPPAAPTAAAGETPSIILPDVPRAASTPQSQPVALATPDPTPSVTPTPLSTRPPLPPIETVILPQPRTAMPLWPWLVGPGGVLALALGWLLLRGRRDDEVDEEIWTEPAIDDAALVSIPASSASDPARLTLALRPTRAGLNLISATAECEVTITNSGGAPAANIRAALRLTSMHGDQDAELAAFYADPIARPATPPFALAPGEEYRFRAVTALPHDAINALDAGGRPMFVPLVALSARYRDGDAARQVGQSYALGVERVDSAKLAPLWLDGPARQYENVAARAHGDAVLS